MVVDLCIVMLDLFRFYFEISKNLRAQVRAYGTPIRICVFQKCGLCLLIKSQYASDRFGVAGRNSN